MLIVTNYPRFPRTWRASNGLSGLTLEGQSPAEFWCKRGPGSVWVVNCSPRLTLKLATLKAIAPHSTSLVVADLVLREATTPAARLFLPCKRFLFNRVDHFIHHFRDLSGYERTYGIGADRSAFVPFKVNFVDQFDLQPVSDGKYILCVGRSLRDFDTFFDAIGQLPYPAAIPRPDPALLALNGGRLTRPWNALPRNIQVLEDDGTERSLLRILQAAKLVVIPVLKTSMAASGISTALNAMILGKCVIGSDGPGMSDIFTQEVLVAPPENPTALAAVIRRAWEDDALRESTAQAGLCYARRVGGEPQLYQRIIDQVCAWFVGHRA